MQEGYLQGAGEERDRGGWGQAAVHLGRSRGQQGAIWRVWGGRGRGVGGQAAAHLRGRGSGLQGGGGGLWTLEVVRQQATCREGGGGGKCRGDRGWVGKGGRGEKGTGGFGSSPPGGNSLAQRRSTEPLPIFANLCLDTSNMILHHLTSTSPPLHPLPHLSHAPSQH